MTDSPILGGFGVSRSKNASDSECVNLFLELIAGKDGRAPGWLQMAPGLDLLVTVGAGPIRGMKPMGGFLYVVSGDTVYQVSTDLTVKSLGQISTGSTPVSMIQNGTQLAIFDGYAGWLTTAALALNGGSPLEGATIVNSGSNYAVGDQVVLAQTGGGQNAPAIITISNIKNVRSGILSGGTIRSGGSGYVIGNTITLAPIGGDQRAAAIVTVTAVSGTGVSAFVVSNPGDFETEPTSFYQASTSGSGIGFEISSPTWNGSGHVASFTIYQGGSYSAEPTAFSQSTTTGSGSGLTLTSPTFGALVHMMQINLPFTGGPLSASYQDGFGIVNDSVSNLWYQSDLFDLSIWQALNFAQADSQPDNVVALADLNREVFVIKDSHTEVWVNAGTTGFVFQRVDGVYIEYGTNAPFSVTLAGQSIILLTQNSQGGHEIRQILGYQPRRISTHAVEQEIAKFSAVADAIAYSYIQEGHLFYVITFPSGDTTFAVDLTDSEHAGQPLWHKRASIESPITGLVDGNFYRHWGNSYATWRSEGSQYRPKGIVMERDQQIATAGALADQPASFTTAVFSVWTYLPDGDDLNGFAFGNGGVQITVSNDASSDTGKQIGVTLLDADWAPIVVATYAWTTWGTWVWIGISVDTSTRTLQVFVGDTPLTPTAITWSSSSAINNNTGVTWSLSPFDEAG